tara:strand:+ start:81 stop:329 length:249 start_codon:yes stop_codon:yes gene_type:complete
VIFKEDINVAISCFFEDELGTVCPVTLVEVIKKNAVSQTVFVIVFDEIDDFFMVFAADINEPIIANGVDLRESLFKKFKFFF